MSIYDAFLKAIRSVGMKRFKETTLFGSSQAPDLPKADAPD